MCRSFRSPFWLLAGSLLCLFAMAGSAAKGDDDLPAAELDVLQLKGISAQRDTIDGPFPGLLLTVADHDPLFDSRYHQPYRAACCAYTARMAPGGPTGYSRRFVVNAPDAEALPTARRVARMLLMLQGEMQSRLRVDHPGRYQTVSVWLTRRVERGLSPDTAGEQFKDQIYLYNLFAERRPIEWMREIAHEYGHFALVPGAVGFTEPEDDSNGVLGERLFLKWVESDLRAGRLRAESVPFVTPDELATYVALQVGPLERRLAREGPDARLLAKRDMEGMDYYTGLLLYLDTLYGSRALEDIRASTRPARSGEFVSAPDFLRGAANSLTEARDQTLHLADLSTNRRSVSVSAYLARGEYVVHPAGPIESWISDDPALHMHSQTLFGVAQSGWHRITVSFSAPPNAGTALHLHRAGLK